MITKKQVAVILSKLKVFENPNIKLEQYPSDSEIISEILWQSYMYNQIEKKVVLDPGCGTGIIGIGALLLNAKKVIFLDIDESSLKILKENIIFCEKEIGIKLFDKVHIIKGDYLNENIEDLKKYNVDTIIQNPPFGTRTEHLDLNFLKKSFFISNIVYSLHKTSTKEYLQKTIEKESFRIFYEFEFSYPLKQSYKHHKKRITRIESICFGCIKEN